MDDIITPDKHSAEIAALNHEIYELTKKLEEKEKQSVLDSTADKNDPFENPTEYKDYRGDYSKIQPRMGEPGYRLPLEPDYAERRSIRKYYSIGGWCLIFQFAVSFGASILLSQIIFALIQGLNPNIDRNIAAEYMTGSSILIGINMIIYLFCNVFNTFLGMKWAKLDVSSLIKTKNFGIGRVVQYCMIALFLWVAAIYAGSMVENIVSKYGLTSVSDQSGVGITPLGVVVTTIYTCVIAPVTEELLFRGMLLKVFSRTNQRFAVFATALFFGLAHGNLPQFILAFLLGIFFAHIDMKHNSIVPSIIVHIFVNTFSTLFSKLANMSSVVVTIATLMLFGAAIVGMIMLLVFRGEEKLPCATPQQSRRGWSVAVSSVPFCAAGIILIIYMAYNLLTSKL